MPGIFWAGVGSEFSYNTISWGPHNAILGGANEAVCDPATGYSGPCGGSDNTFEYNEISDVAFECSDTGAFYSCGQQGTAWVTRGNVVRGNKFTRVRMTEPTSLGYASVQAIYLDDQNSGWTIEDNSFVDCQTGMFVGGGRDNVVRHNSFAHCDTAVHVDNRGMNWEKSGCAEDLSLAQESFKWPAWSKYAITLTEPCVPVNNTIEDNTYCECGKFVDVSSADLAAWKDVVANNNETKAC